MDKTTAKTRLSAFRPGGPDEDDPFFAEALREARRQQDLAAWFEEELRQDARVVAAFGQTPVPATLKETILLNASRA